MGLWTKLSVQQEKEWITICSKMKLISPVRITFTEVIFHFVKDRVAEQFGLDTVIIASNDDDEPIDCILLLQSRQPISNIFLH